MGSKILGLLAMFLFISSEVAARDLKDGEMVSERNEVNGWSRGGSIGIGGGPGGGLFSPGYRGSVSGFFPPGGYYYPPYFRPGGGFYPGGGVGGGGNFPGGGVGGGGNFPGVGVGGGGIPGRG
ncbi:hypothetical protein Fmac_030923 [Flemingia macrophylla]|uniref:Glycine-rich protein n=1 Tax=Flemingia macrophylla TaxID=520843 RepID=A0ABD1L0L9_9FABA